MSKIDISAWKSFVVADLFQIERPNARIATELDGGNIPFVASGNYNNGIEKYVDSAEELDRGNCITISPVDGSAFYQPNDFLGRGGAGSSIVILRSPRLNQYNGLFLSSILGKVCGKYNYSNMGSASKIKNEVVCLPFTKTGDPDWEYMESYIKDKISTYKSNIQILTTITFPKKIEKINTCDWGNFKVSELFEIHNGKGITKNEIFAHPGDIPAIQSGEENYGCIGYLDKDYCVQQKYSLSKGMCLTVARSGSSGYVGYQSEQCVVGDSAKVLEPKFVANKERLLFLQTVLLQLKPMYAYSDKVTTDNYSKQIIKLPITAEGKPDWNYMENTIRNIMYNSEQYIKAINYA